MLVSNVVNSTHHGSISAQEAMSREGNRIAQVRAARLRRVRRLEEDVRIARMNQKRYRESTQQNAAYVEETARSRRFTGLSFRGPRHDRRAWTTWAGLDIWEIVEAYKAVGYEELVEEGEISQQALDLALGYYGAYPEEVNSLIAENRKPPEDWHRLFPDVIPCYTAS